MPEKFDAIIVGAGPAGSIAALGLAQAGLKVAVFERGEHAGSKNMFGGALYYTEILDKLIPGFWREAPLERHVLRHALVFSSGDASVEISYSDKQFGQPPYNAVTLLRAKFDKWLAEKAMEAGALVIPETLVNDLVFEENRIVGVMAARSAGLIHADTVIIAEGANSLLVEKAGLGGAQEPEDFAVGAKEILALSREIIDRRFTLSGDEGACYSFVGDCIRGLEGGGFLYTNKSSVSVGVVARLSSLRDRAFSIADLLEYFKGHHAIMPMIEGAEIKEYSAHLIPEGGLKTSPRFYGDGVLVVGDAARFLCSTGLTLQGMNFAIASGFAAAEAVKIARKTNDFTKKTLKCYKKILEETFVLPTLRTFRHAPSILGNPRIYTTYPAVICGTLHRIFKGGDHPRKKFLHAAISEIKKRGAFGHLLKDGIGVLRGLLW